MEAQQNPGWQAADLHAWADLLAGVAPAGLPSEHLDQLEALQRVKAAAAAAQVSVTAAFADDCDSEDVPASGRRTPPRAMSIGAEVALATLASPHAGEQRVLLSRRLRDDLPSALAALGRGELTEDRAFAVAREVAHLTPEQRRAVDDDLAPRLPGLGDVKLRLAVRRSCLTLAADAETKRYRRARADRHVTSRALDDGTGRLTAILPLETLAAVRAALDEVAATARADGDPRSGGQVRADTLAARVTGSNHQSDPATDTPAVRVNLVIGVESLFGDGTEPGLVDGLGFLPAALCTDLVRAASAAAKATLRRLFATPQERALVAMESTSRRFDGLLAEFLEIRDGGICRTTGCNAVIKDIDHVERAADGGPPQPSTVRVSANAATTSRRPPAGPPGSTPPARTSSTRSTASPTTSASPDPPARPSPADPPTPGAAHPPSSSSPAPTP